MVKKKRAYPYQQAYGRGVSFWKRLLVFLAGLPIVSGLLMVLPDLLLTMLSIVVLPHLGREIVEQDMHWSSYAGMISALLLFVVLFRETLVVGGRSLRVASVIYKVLRRSLVVIVGISLITALFFYPVSLPSSISDSVISSWLTHIVASIILVMIFIGILRHFFRSLTDPGYRRQLRLFEAQRIRQADEEFLRKKVREEHNKW